MAAEVGKVASIAAASIGKIMGVAEASIGKMVGVAMPAGGGFPLVGWSYRKSITLSRASGAVNNYQMKLLVGESSGATGEDVDCGGHVAADFDDLRFTTSDGSTLLDYWIESVSGATPNCLATVWIEFNTIGTGATTFYMYYGGTETAVSSGANTFIVFDDFERGANDDGVGGIWTEDTGHSHISTDHAYGGSRSVKMIGSTGTISFNGPVTLGDIAINFRVWKEDNPDSVYIIGNGTKIAYVKIDTNENLCYYNGSSWIDTTKNVAKDAWGKIELRNFDFSSAFTYDLYSDDVLAKTDANIFNNALTANTWYFQMYTSGNGNDSYYDNFIVRQFLKVEPAWGSWGSEESA